MTPRALIAPARLAGQSLLRTQTDERLVDLVRAGNDGAFEALVMRYRRPLLRYCEGILPGPRAEDAVQQVFVRAYDALRESEGEMKVRPWLYRIAHNTALNGLRDRALGDAELDPRSAGAETPDGALERREELREVLGAVQGLPERQRDAIVLRELEGRSYDEIAVALGVTGGSVRMLLNRARTTVRTGMTAITPFTLLSRVPDGLHDGGAGARIAELVGIGGGAAIAKVGATVLVTGAVVGGGVAVETHERPARAESPAVTDVQPRVIAPSSAGEDPGRGGDDSGNSGKGSSGSGGDSSGKGSGGSGSSSSGKGSGGAGDSSGSGSSGSGSSGSGSSGSGSGSSGSGSGDDTPDFDSSGSGGSGSSGGGDDLRLDDD